MRSCRVFDTETNPENSSRFVDAFHRKEFLYYENCASGLVPVDLGVELRPCGHPKWTPSTRRTLAYIFDIS